MRNNGCLVNDVAKAHGGKQLIQTPNGVRLPLIIKNGLAYLEHYYPTDEQMNDENMPVEWMTNKGDWDPSKFDDIEGASERRLSQFSPIPVDAIDPFYTIQGDIKVTKSDSKEDLIVETVVDEDEDESTIVTDSDEPNVAGTTEDTTTTDATSSKDPVVIDVKKEAVKHLSKPKVLKKKKKGGWTNNKKVKWTADTKPPSLPSHLLPRPRTPGIEGLPAAVEAQLRAYFGTPLAASKADLQDNVDVDDNNGEPTDDGDYGEQINSELYSQSEQDIGPTGATIMHEGVLFAQYSNCHHELYYESCEMYGDDPEDSEQAQSRLANSGEVTWDTIHSHSLEDDSEFQSDFLYDQFVIEQNQRLACQGTIDKLEDVGITEAELHQLERNKRLAYQGKIDELEDVGITEAELHQAQAPLKPTVRRPDPQDYERMRKYFGHIPADIIRQTFKHTTQIGILPPSTHLRRRFKSPNPALNLHRRNEADATDQVFAKEGAIDGGETSCHIFVGQDSKITDVYKAKDNGGA